MSRLAKTSLVLASALAASALSRPARAEELDLDTEADRVGNDLGLEAIVAPQISLATGSGTRSRFGVEFFRLSSGFSLVGQYGTGGGYVDYTILARLSGFHQFFHEPYSRGFVYGVGLGASASPGVDAALTHTVKQAGYSDVLVNPYVRYLFDINGWVGPYLEVGYEIIASRLAWAKDIKPLGAPSGHFMIGLGVAFEVER